MSGNSGKREHGSYGGGGGGQNHAKRRMFTKLVKDSNAVIADVYQGKRFIEGMESFESKAELLAKLQDSRDEGMRRIRDVLSFTNSVGDVETLLIPMIRCVMNEETSRPVFRSLRDKVLMGVYAVPGLMETLVANNVARELDQPSATQLCLLLRALTKAFMEPRQSEPVLDMAKALRERGDIDEARVLCSFLLVDERGVEATHNVESVANPVAAACWVTDTVPPGGRHDNDHLNFRNIRLVPTVEELACVTKPYLPLATGENRVIEDPEAFLLDKNFRLLREDAVATMRESIAETTKGVWKNARIIDLDIGRRGSLTAVSFVVRLDRPASGNPNWKRSRVLMSDSVVALCRDHVPVRMGSITTREEDWLKDPGGPKIGVAFESDKDFEDSVEEMVQNSSVEMSIKSLREELASVRIGDKPRRQRLLQRLDTCMGRLTSYDFVEVSKSFFSYRPILKTLQSMDTIPFADELTTSLTPGIVARPSYIPEKVFMPKDKDFGAYECSLSNWSASGIAEATSLDTSQAEALRHALTSPVALVQGPPGCGKTFIGALVARMIRENTNESILCVCYTNHALDQFLEHMLDAGEKRLVRIGGRSKSERLAGFQLRALAQSKVSQDSFCQRRIKQVDAQYYKLRDSILESLKAFSESVDWKKPFGGIRGLLEMDEPHILELLSVPSSDDGFNMVGAGGKPVRDDSLWNSWRKGESLPAWMSPFIADETLERTATFWNLSLDERVAMLEEWRREVLRPEAAALNERVAELSSLMKEKQALRQESDLQILRDARIIGATTSGAAKYRDLLTVKGAGVVLVEEAGEVLESHILTSLSGHTSDSEATKHLILIGDHKQLRPKLENYDLSTVSGHGYNLDCSLFERLILKGQPSVALEVQHRMRPSISALVRAQTYPNLQDHESVNQYPDVMGVSENLVFIDHQHMEDGADKDVATTKANSFEAELSVELVRYFLLQGYQQSQIVVLTPYLGQLLKLTQLMRSELKEVNALVSDTDTRELEELDQEQSASESHGASPSDGVRCSTIDNFQGEEADIIVVSLVRANKRGIIGFLKEEQRVNVLLSRARHGMFLIGSSSTLTKSSAGRKVWEPIVEMLDSAGRLLNGLPTTCQLHPEDAPLRLSLPTDFRNSRPNGGCHRPCDYRLSCGHVCPMMCHPIDRSHQRAQLLCSEPCKRFPPECALDHPCPKLCNEKCGPCTYPVGPIKLTCSHVAESVQCHLVRSPGALESFSQRCREKVPHKFEACGHTADTTCANTQVAVPQCPARCGSTANCEHPCTNRCGTCDGRHKCQQKCDRLLFCGHTCGRPCHLPDECSPCEKRCVATCSHSRCPEKCSSPCASCVEKCDWHCEHQGSCQLVCGAPCSRLPCNERCGKILSCGHRCPSLCGEDCPDSKLCHECGSSQRAQVVDMLCLTAYDSHNVDDDPVIFLPCGHFFSVSTLDGWLDIAAVYETNESGPFTGLKSLAGSGVGEKPKQCPDCRAVIHSIRRYGRVLRLIELRGLERKSMMFVQRALQNVAGRLETTKKGALVALEKVEKSIRRSPMRVIFEACGGNRVVETAPPPSAPLIRCLELKATVFGRFVKTYNDSNFEKAKRAYKEAMVVADSSSSYRSGATLRLALAKLLVNACGDTGPIRSDADSLLDWILNLHVKFDDLIMDARNLKTALEKPSDATIQSVVEAMSRTDGYDYGGSSSSHWFECPNGHPFFIGECGGAMQVGQCIECGEPVGGRRHALLGTNSQGAGVVHDAVGR